MGLSRLHCGLRLLGLAFFLVVLLSPLAHTQSLFGVGLPQMPFLGAPSEPAYGYGQDSGYYGAPPATATPSSALRVDAGYLWGSRGVVLSESVNGQNFFTRNSSTLRAALEGFQIGASLQVPVPRDINLIFRGSWLVPSNKRLEIINDDQYQTTRKWRAKNQYYTLEASFECPMGPGLNVLGGFRYDSIQLRLKQPEEITANGFLPTYPKPAVHPNTSLIPVYPLQDPEGFGFYIGSPLDRSEITVNNFIPFLGVALDYGRALRVSVVGTPIFWTDIKYAETAFVHWDWWRSQQTSTLIQPNPLDPLTWYYLYGYDWNPEYNDSANSLAYRTKMKSGQFVEGVLECELPVGPGNVSAMARWTYMRGTGKTTLKQNSAANGYTVPQIFNPGPYSDQREGMDMTLVRHHVYVGGSYTLPFTLPF